MIKAVIFDMDGVLVDSEPYYLGIYQLCFKHFGIDVSMDELLPIAGGTTKHHNGVINPILAKHHVERSDFDKYVHQYYQDHPVPYPDILMPNVEEVFQWVLSHGYRLALASSSYQHEIKGVLSSCHLEQYVELICSGDMFKEAKPNPEIYITCVNKLGLTPEECVAIEDSDYGIEAAKNAHLTCIVRRENRFNFKQDKGDYMIEKLTDIIPILENIRKEENS